jgi:hypothetical protein
VPVLESDRAKVVNGCSPSVREKGVDRRKGLFTRGCSEGFILVSRLK